LAQAGLQAFREEKGMQSSRRAAARNHAPLSGSFAQKRIDILLDLGTGSIQVNRAYCAWRDGFIQSDAGSPRPFRLAARRSLQLRDNLGERIATIGPFDPQPLILATHQNLRVSPVSAGAIGHFDRRIYGEKPIRIWTHLQTTRYDFPCTVSFDHQISNLGHSSLSFDKSCIHNNLRQNWFASDAAIREYFAHDLGNTLPVCLFPGELAGSWRFCTTS
jgi:hypothetical protein